MVRVLVLRGVVVLAVLGAGMPAGWAQGSPALIGPITPPNQVLPPMATYMQRAFAAFDAADSRAMPPPGGVLFVGSSSIAFWPDLRGEFSEYPVIIQRGIAGSRMADLALYADRLAVRYQPGRIVVYAGENDVAAGIPAANILEAFRLFVDRVSAALPGVSIAWVSIKPSPSRWTLEDKFRQANTAVSSWIATREGVEYIELHDAMLGADGMPRRELYADDQLHLGAEGYALWEQVIEERLRQLPSGDGGRSAGDVGEGDAVEDQERTAQHGDLKPQGVPAVAQ